LVAVGQPFNDFESVSFLLKDLGSELDPFVTSVTTQVDHLSLDKIRIEQQLPSLDLTQPSTNYSPRAPMHRGRGYRGRGSSSGGHSYFYVEAHLLAIMDMVPTSTTPLLGATKGSNQPIPRIHSSIHRPISRIPRPTILLPYQMRKIGTPILR